MLVLYHNFFIDLSSKLNLIMKSVLFSYKINLTLVTYSLRFKLNNTSEYIFFWGLI